MKKSFRALAFLLALLLSFSMFPASVYAADGDTAAYTLTVTADTDTGKEAIGKTEFYVNGFDTAKGQLPLDTPL